jgi:hypothetical protein
MPGGDRTGPMGEGPLTGRGSGYCAGASYPRRFSRGGDGGWDGGFGRGGGRGRRNRSWATGRPSWRRAGEWQPSDRLPDASVETLELERATAALEAELRRLRTRIEDLERNSTG